MIEIKMKVDEVDYERALETLLPLLAEHFSSKTDNALISGILSKTKGLPVAAVKAMLKTLSLIHISRLQRCAAVFTIRHIRHSPFRHKTQRHFFTLSYNFLVNCRYKTAAIRNSPSKTLALYLTPPRQTVIPIFHTATKRAPARTAGNCPFPLFR